MSSAPDEKKQPLEEPGASVLSADSSIEEKEAFGLVLKDGIPPLATSSKPISEQDAKEGPITGALLRFFRLRPQTTFGLDEIATQPSVYDTDQAKFFQPREDWENIEAFDPDFRWTWKEERTALRKVDWKILTWVILMFLALDIDRGNLASATADGFLKDLHLTQKDYNLGSSLSKAGFLIAELPSQLISKRLGPDVWIPIQILIFSVLSGAQFWLNGRASFLTFRFLIAAFQGGFIPDVILYLSYYYTKTDLPIRLAFFYTMNPFSGTLTGFLGTGLNTMRGVRGKAGWRWMFLIEGLLTLIVGVASFWMMPSCPTRTKTSFRKNGYLTDREAKIIVNRVIRDDPEKGGMHNRQSLTLKMVWKSFGDYDLMPLYFLGLVFGLAATPVAQYLQISFKTLGFSTVMANLLTVPSSVISIIMLIVISVVSEAFDNRSFVCMAQNLWLLPCFIALQVLPKIGAWQYFAIATVLLGYPYVHSVQVGWASRNSGSVRTRTVSASLYNMSVQLSSIIGANIYQPSDAPRYKKGNSALLGIIAFNLVVLYPGIWFYYTWRNKKKAAIWDNMTSEEKSHYLATTTDEGNKRLNFQFAK